MRLGETAAPTGGESVLCSDFALYTLAFALQLMKNHGKTSVRLSERRSADQRRMRLGDRDGFDWPAGPCRPWVSLQAMGSTLDLRKYLLSCRTRDFPT